MKLTIDISQRYAASRAHTATHLLHAQLLKYIPETKQEWSYVGSDELRFDFASSDMLTTEQLTDIQNTINHQIYTWYDVSISQMSLDSALTLWAKAFFMDKYWETVRVVSVGDFSVELCGGTHVSNTREIWWCVITGITSISAWVKRITAYTWTKIVDYLQEKNAVIESIAYNLSCNPKQIVEKVEKLNKHQQYLQHQNLSMLSYIVENMTTMHLKRKLIDMRSWVLSSYEISEILSTKKTDMLIIWSWWAYALVWHWAKSQAMDRWLRWWWHDTLFQWKDPKIIELL